MAKKSGAFSKMLKAMRFTKADYKACGGARKNRKARGKCMGARVKARAVEAIKAACD